MTAVYNEIDDFAAEWLVNLTRGGHIADGRVDRRSVKDLQPQDVNDATQFHAFAGIGAWSYALRLAGWPDDRPVWTGSCPCQPFSQAGRGGGFDDDRHLWPEWFRLIRECRPPIIFGEQVASPAGLGWFDVVSADLESQGYAVGAADLCAAGVGAPHIRQRLYFVAIAGGERLEGLSVHLPERRSESGMPEVAGRGVAGVLADARGEGLEVRRVESARRELAAAKRGGATSVMGDTRMHDGTRRFLEPHGRASLQPDRSGPTSGFWADADWLLCRDGKSRPVESGTFPLADRAPARVGRLRGYGNAIVPQVAAPFIQAVMEIMLAVRV